MLQPTTDARQRLAFFATYPLREKWVGDVVACIVRIGLSRGQIGHNITYPLLTKWVQRQTRFVVGSNIKTPLSRGGYARKTDAHPLRHFLLPIPPSINYHKRRFHWLGLSGSLTWG